MKHITHSSIISENIKNLIVIIIVLGTIPVESQNPGGNMNKDKIKKALKGLGIAGLVASVGLMTVGCKKAADAPAGNDAAPETKSEDGAKGSCGKGSCGGADKDAKGSCGKGSCGGDKKATE
jgi:radical SAM modification target selenobiotic family peptide